MAQKTTKTVEELTTKRQRSEVKKIISDYEANALIAANLIKVIQSGDIKAWKQGWHFGLTKTDLYYEVIDGNAAAYALWPIAITIENFMGYDDCPIPAGFYLNFKEIKALKLKLKKGAKGQPLYEKRFFYKQLTKKEEETIKEDENLSLEWEILQEDHRHQFKACFDCVSEKGNKYHFEEVILWDNYKNRPAYQRGQYVLVYYYNNNDLVEPIDVKKRWGVGDRPIRSEAQKIDFVESVKNDYINRAHLNLTEKEQGHAYYQPALHRVTMPLMKQFDDSKEYYQTLFHEFSHSTGHFTLLNRKSLYQSHNSWGYRTKDYNKEELAAELSSLFILDNMGVLSEAVFKNSASYMAGWGSSFGTSIKHNIINTLKNALAAAELVLNKCLKGKKTKKEEYKEESTTTEEVKASSKVEAVATTKAEDKKSFAQMMRDLNEGAMLKTVINNVKPERNGEIRKIVKKQTNAIAFENKEDANKPSWLWWDKKHYAFEYIGNTIKVFHKKSNELLFEYEIVSYASESAPLDESIGFVSKKEYEEKKLAGVRNLTAKEMIKKAVSFIGKSKRDYLKKCQYIDDKQVITNSVVMARLTKADYISEIEEDKNPEVKYSSFIDFHYKPQFEPLTTIKAGLVRLALKNKKETYELKCGDVCYHVATKELVGLLNMLKINNDEEFITARVANDNHFMKPLKILKAVNNWNGEEVSDGIISPLRIY